MILQTIVQDNLIEILLTIVLSFNIGAYKLLWERIHDLDEGVEKNSESIDVILKRIFGIEQDPTDDGHIMETEQRFEDIGEKLEEISLKQDRDMRERKEEHKHVDNKISSIIQVLADEERVDIAEDDFNDRS